MCLCKELFSSKPVIIANLLAGIGIFLFAKPFMLLGAVTLMAGFVGIQLLYNEKKRNDERK